MAGGSKKRKTAEVRAPAEPPQRYRKRRVTPTESPVTEDEIQPSGFPFILEEVEWSYVRLELLDKPHKVFPGGYESMAGDVNLVLKSLPYVKADLAWAHQLRHVERLILRGCLRHVERLILKTPLTRGMGTPAEILAYRHQVAKTIYAHSTDASMIPMVLPQS